MARAFIPSPREARIAPGGCAARGARAGYADTECPIPGECPIPIDLAAVLEGVIAIRSEIVPAPITLRNMMARSGLTLPPDVGETHSGPDGSTGRWRTSLAIIRYCVAARRISRKNAPASCWRPGLHKAREQAGQLQSQIRRPYHQRQQESSTIMGPPTKANRW
jgi:hypothetical protein